MCTDHSNGFVSVLSNQDHFHDGRKRHSSGHAGRSEADAPHR